MTHWLIQVERYLSAEEHDDGRELYECAIVARDRKGTSTKRTRVLATSTWLEPRLKDLSTAKDRFTSVAARFIETQLLTSDDLAAEYDLGKYFTGTDTMEQLYADLRSRTRRSTVLFTDGPHIH